MNGSSKPILDACCGGRMFWFDKQNPATVFMDKRIVPPTVVNTGKNARIYECRPDVVADFKEIPYPDDTFSLVVFDPPHLVRAGDMSYMAIKYGKLPQDWQTELGSGFRECMRVLKPEGTLIFKWNETQLPVSKVIDAVGYEPLFGHRSGKKSQTHWLCFMKGVSKPSAQGRLPL